MINKPLILIVDDEESICNFISVLLITNGFHVIKAKNGKEAIELASNKCPDLILLDLGLPEIDGIEVLKTLRLWSQIPIIVVSARGHEREKVEALDCGADDYITKPFGTDELLARVRNALRHSTSVSQVELEQTDKFTLGDLEINYKNRNIQLAGHLLHFTPIEYRIIVLLSHYAGKVLTHEYIIKQIWGPYSEEIHVLRVNMANIRRKIELNPAEPKYIITEVGVGYRMKDEII
jgi:two-component system, OmpR family, KDP operon response regulator KdpE